MGRVVKFPAREASAVSIMPRADLVGALVEAGRRRGLRGRPAGVSTEEIVILGAPWWWSITEVIGTRGDDGRVVALPPLTAEELAREAGFTDAAALIRDIKRRHGLPFEGVAIRWERVAG